MSESNNTPINHVAECAQAREEKAEREYTVADAILDAQWVRRTPDGIFEGQKAKTIILTLLSALEASPCYLKAVKERRESFTILDYDKAGHNALHAWAYHAELHGARPAKLAEAYAKAEKWSQLPDARWPT